MSILSANLLIFVNDALRRSETDIDAAIRLTVDDLAGLHSLQGYSSANAITNTTESVAYPADALDDDAAIISVTLLSSAGETLKLNALPGGWDEYQGLVEGTISGLRSTPAWYVCHNRAIYLYPPPSESYTGRWYYYRRHGTSLTTLEFTDDWTNACKFGAAYYWAMLRKLPDYLQIWGTAYQNEKERLRLRIPRKVPIMRG